MRVIESRCVLFNDLPKLLGCPTNTSLLCSTAMVGCLSLSVVACSESKDTGAGTALTNTPESAATSIPAEAATKSAAPSAPSTTFDSATGLIVAPHWELAKAHCGACHSYRLVTAQRGDHAYWSKTISWMQSTQNLWQIPEPGLSDLVGYLAENYNESEWGRRPPLSPSLLPD